MRSGRTLIPIADGGVARRMEAFAPARIGARDWLVALVEASQD